MAVSPSTQIARIRAWVDGFSLGNTLQGCADYSRANHVWDQIAENSLQDPEHSSPTPDYGLAYLSEAANLLAMAAL